MLQLSIVILFTSLLVGSTYYLWSRMSHRPREDLQMSEFRSFMKKYHKLYADPQEFDKRLRIFKASLHRIQTENAKGNSYTLAVNEFADQDAEEFSATHLGIARPDAGKFWQGVPHLGTDVYSGKTLPTSVDWTEHGAVTPPKNQAHCGSCWSFSAAGSLEGAWKIHSGNLVSFSEQQLVDCAKIGNNGCKGGLMDHAFSFYKSHAVCTEASYPYLAKDGICAESQCTQGIPEGGVKGFKIVVPDDENALMEAVGQQPVSVAIEADQTAFQLYHSGVLTRACGAKLDHGVLLVGYGASEDNVPYWKVKNSWGAGWGEQGFIRIQRAAAKKKAGECGIQSNPSYPVVSGDSPAPGPSPGPSPSPTPPPSPPAPAVPHYEKPPCASDEVEASIDGLDGAVCAPRCDDNGRCPAVPRGSFATPQCILKDHSGNQYCSLTCASDVACPRGAKCEKQSSDSIMGMCMYQDTHAQSLPLAISPKGQTLTAAITV